MPCAAHAIAVRDHLDRLGTETAVVMVTFTAAHQAGAYQLAHDLPFPVLIDPDRSTYRAYGLGRGSVTRVWGWRAGRRYIDLIRQEGVRGLRRPSEDTLQLGGDFVIDPEGRLSWGFWGEGPDDRPGIDELVAEVDRHRR
ncbi:MAG: AhpC/TSA family protein [Acidimicrobiales bacterium]